MRGLRTDRTRKSSSPGTPSFRTYDAAITNWDWTFHQHCRSPPFAELAQAI
jgi:hypothetical protein